MKFDVGSRWRQRIYCAKQSQSVAARGTNKANFGTDRKGRERQDCRCRRAGQLCETKPICRWPVGRRGQARKTNPISRSRQPSGVGRLCKTNPISPGPAGPPPDPIVQNEPNLQEPSAVRSGPIVQNEPNFGELVGRTRVPTVRAARAAAGVDKRAKRSQFPPRADAMDLEPATVCRPLPPCCPVSSGFCLTLAMQSFIKTGLFSVTDSL